MHKGTEVVKYIADFSFPVTVTYPVKGTRASKTSFGVVAEVPKAAIVAVEILAFVDI